MVAILSSLSLSLSLSSPSLSLSLVLSLFPSPALSCSLSHSLSLSLALSFPLPPPLSLSLSLSLSLRESLTLPHPLHLRVSHYLFIPRRTGALQLGWSIPLFHGFKAKWNITRNLELWSSWWQPAWTWSPRIGSTDGESHDKQLSVLFFKSSELEIPRSFLNLNDHKILYAPCWVVYAACVTRKYRNTSA